MAIVYAEVKGIADLKAKILALDAGMRQKTMIEVAMEGGRILQAAIRANAPRETGALANDIQVRVRKTALQHEGLVQVGPEKTAWRAKFIERGVRFHVIRKKRKKVLADKATNTFFGPFVRHRGITARPFIRPALERNRPIMAEAMQQKLLEIIHRIV
jgi:HK97 gp10 family phage protein